MKVFPRRIFNHGVSDAPPSLTNGLIERRRQYLDLGFLYLR
jgi:hypothetical protein